MKVDIVGAGPGGLSTAITLKEQDKSINVVVHEKNKEVGFNPEGRRCGEAHGIYKGLEKWQPVGKSIFNVINKEIFEIGDYTHTSKISSLVNSVVMLNRQKYISQLGDWAKKLDVEISTNDKIKSVYDLDGGFIVDASGCPSSIKKELGLKGGLKGITYQHTIENSNCFTPDTLRFIFREAVGYYWIFPRDPAKKEVNVGIGIAGLKESRAKSLLEDFKKEWKIEGDVNYTTGGIIPVGLQRPLMHKNILFVGDTGAGTFPFTGEGIYRSIFSGETAGKCIASGSTKKYPSIINHEFIK